MEIRSTQFISIELVYVGMCKEQFLHTNISRS